MNEVNLKNANILPINLDSKQSANKTLTELKTKFQTGSLLNGVVTEVTENSDVIFTTMKETILMPNIFNLIKGDKINIRLTFEDNKVYGELMKINDNAASTEKVELNIMLAKTNIPKTSTFSVSKNEIETTKVIDLLEKIIKAEVKYISLNEINKNSQFYKNIISNEVTKGTVIEFQITNLHEQNFLLPNQIKGEIVSDIENNKQLAKTNFGIIEIENTDLPLGKEIILEMKTINGNKVNYISPKILTQDFLFKINNNDSLLQNVINKFFPKIEKPKEIEKHINNTIKSILNKNSQNKILESQTSSQKNEIYSLKNNNYEIEQVVSRRGNQPDEMESSIEDTKLTEKLSDSMIKEEHKDKNNNSQSLLNHKNLTSSIRYKESFSNKSMFEQNFIQKEFNFLEDADNEKSFNLEIIKILSKEENKIIFKELIESYNKISDIYQLDKKFEFDKWYPMLLPFTVKDEPEEKQIFIQKKNDNITRFLVNINLEEWGDIQLDGLVKTSLLKEIESFDLNVSFKNIVAAEMIQGINQIFSLCRDINHINGTINFNTDFIEVPT